MINEDDYWAEQFTKAGIADPGSDANAARDGRMDGPNWRRRWMLGRVTKKPDPRDQGFNYGAAFGAKRLDPARFETFRKATDRARALREVADRYGRLSWRLDMAMRDVRLSCSHEEQATAYGRLIEVLVEIDAATGNKYDDPTPNYSFDEIAAIGQRAVSDAIDIGGDVPTIANAVANNMTAELDKVCGQPVFPLDGRETALPHGDPQFGLLDPEIT